jgi:hypothetical protein
MSEFLRNLAARSRATFEAMAPRVPSRFEPMRTAEGLLAVRGPQPADGLEDAPGMEGTEGAEITAADPMDRFAHVARQTAPAEPMNLPPRRKHSPPAAAESVTGTIPIRPTESGVPLAELGETPVAYEAPILREKGIPRSSSAGFATPKPGRAAADQPIDPATTTASTREGEARREGTEGRGARRLRSASSLTGSSLGPEGGAPGSNRVEPEESRDSRALSAPVLAPRRDTDPVGHAFPSASRARSDRTRMAPPVSESSLLTAVALGRSRELFPDESEAQSDPADSPGPRRAKDAVDRRPDLKPDRTVHTSLGQETGRHEIGAKPAFIAGPAVPNLLPAPQPPAAAASEPAIHVTIGRLEVRAVFSDHPAKRSAPPRFKPRVSLDDYLNRGRGAAR